MAAAVGEALARGGGGGGGAGTAAQAAPARHRCAASPSSSPASTRRRRPRCDVQLVPRRRRRLDAYPEDGDARRPVADAPALRGRGPRRLRGGARGVQADLVAPDARRRAPAPPPPPPAPAAAAPRRAPPVLPASYVDRWDREHVRLPCSPRAGARPPRRGAAAADAVARAARRAVAAAGGRRRAARRDEGGARRDRRPLEAVGAPRVRHRFPRRRRARARFFGASIITPCALALRLPELCPDGLPLLRRGHASPSA